VGDHPRNVEALRRSERDGEAIRNAEPVRPPNPYQPILDTHREAQSRQEIARTEDEIFERALLRENVKRQMGWDDKRIAPEDVVRLDRELAAEPRDAKIRRYDNEMKDWKALESGEAYARSKGKTLSLDQQRRLEKYREIDRRLAEDANSPRAARERDGGRDR